MGADVHITVVDAIMGAGKTSAAIQFMEEHSDMRFLFITPYLDEGERIINSCPRCKFRAPRVCGNKVAGLKSLLKRRDNIVSTHALFGHFDDECMEMIRSGGYTLIMDEVYEPVVQCQISDSDYQMLSDSGWIEISEQKTLAWVGPDDYTGALSPVKNMITRSTIIVSKGDDGKDQFFSILPTKSFSCFRSIYILTYMFDGSILKSYFDYYGFTYRFIGVNREAGGSFRFSEKPTDGYIKGLRDHIRIWMPKKGNEIGSRQGSLSYSWFKNHPKNSPQIQELRKNIRNFFTNVAKAGSGTALWTTYKHAEKKLSGPGYTRGFLAHNARATNQYKGRTAVVYAVNKYLNPWVKDFFAVKNIEVDEDQYALSSMVQFIWRSAIRDGEDIDIYIPSLRMRQLFESWIMEVNEY